MSSSISADRFCGGAANIDSCMVEYLVLLWPYYMYFLVLFPVRVFEIRLLPRSYPPRWWPFTHLAKRVLVLVVLGTTLVALCGLGFTGQLWPYLLLSGLIHLSAWSSAYWVLSSEYKRYQPVTWFGLRGFWVLTGFEGFGRLFWIFASPIDASPDYLLGSPGWSLLFVGLLAVCQLSMLMLVVWVPNDLNIHLLSHIQRLLLEHPSTPRSTGTTVFTLHEAAPASKYQAKRADTPGWIYSVEEELPFLPKIDVLDVHVLAINKDQTMRTVYRIRTRVTTATAVVEFSTKRRYKDLRFLDDQLRRIFNHSRFPEQRASLGNFPPRELTQADPFARQIALREYLRRLSVSPVFYTQEFLDMVGVDPRLSAGTVYEACLVLQNAELAKLAGAPRKRYTTNGPPYTSPGLYCVREPMPWRPPALLNGLSSAESPLHTPPPPSPQAKLTVNIPDYTTAANRVVYYRIVTRSAIGAVFESKHRFSDFQRLVVHLRDFLDVKISASLPPLFRLGQTQAEFLELRRAALETFLQTLLVEHPCIVSSRFVRTFFRIVTGEDEAPVGTPGSSASSGLEEDPVEPVEDVSSLVTPSLVVSIPFWCYSLDQKSIFFCVRAEEAACTWTRFHCFEAFAELRSDLGVPDIDFPAVSRNPLATKAPAEIDTRKNILANWLRALTVRCGADVRTACPALWNFIRQEDEPSE